jgi:hypothetical protein
MGMSHAAAVSTPAPYEIPFIAQMYTFADRSIATSTSWISLEPMLRLGLTVFEARALFHLADVRADGVEDRTGSPDDDRADLRVGLDGLYVTPQLREHPRRDAVAGSVVEDERGDAAFAFESYGVHGSLVGGLARAQAGCWGPREDRGEPGGL